MSESFAANGRSGTVNVIAEGRCAWQAVSNVGWVTITSNNKGIGNGLVAYSVAANASVTGRAGIITIAGKAFTVKQTGN